MMGGDYYSQNKNIDYLKNDGTLNTLAQKRYRQRQYYIPGRYPRFLIKCKKQDVE